jgi:hypothetical protein
MFRINIYSYPDSLPNLILNSNPIYVSANIKNGWVVADLRKHDINLSDNFVITIEPVQAWGLRDQTRGNIGNHILISGNPRKANGLIYSRGFSLGLWRKDKGLMDFYLTGF